MGPLSFNFQDLSFKAARYQKDLYDEELVIRNTFLNAQPGQLVQFGNKLIPRPPERTIQWVDEGTKREENRPKTARAPLAKLIPIEDTVNFSKRVETHYSRS